MTPFSHDEKAALVERTHTIPLARQTQLLGISRTSLYYRPTVSERDLKNMEAIDRIYTDHPYYGSRRMRLALRDKYQLSIGRAHLRTLMRTMGLVAIYPKHRTTGSEPNTAHKKYPYLLNGVIAAYPNHIWGTDITYIPLRKGFCYLVAIIDWYSRYIVHWELSETLEIQFCLDNLARSLAVATPTIHNSDQGSHFTSPQYTGLLTAAGVSISMDGKGRCMDNIFTERLWRTIKYENVYLKSYATFEEAKAGLAEYMQFYNFERRHQSLEYQRPAELYKNEKTVPPGLNTLHSKPTDLSLSILSTFSV